MSRASQPRAGQMNGQDSANSIIALTTALGRDRLVSPAARAAGGTVLGPGFVRAPPPQRSASNGWAQS
jgi:hypothetical protein